jgi:hypothetical protein
VSTSAVVDRPVTGATSGVAAVSPGTELWSGPPARPGFAPDGPKKVVANALAPGRSQLGDALSSAGGSRSGFRTRTGF